MLGQKTGGRTKGTPNRQSLKLEEFLEKRGIFIPEKLLEAEAELVDPKDKVKVWLELMSYVFPKRKAIEVSGDYERPFAHLSVDELNARILKNLSEDGLVSLTAKGAEIAEKYGEERLS